MSSRRALVKLIVMTLLLAVVLAAGAWWALTMLGDTVRDAVPTLPGSGS